MEEKKILNTVKTLVEPGVFALLIVLTVDDNVVLRPIGGPWGAGIRDAVQEMAQKYPECKIRLLEQSYDCNNWERYFQGIVSKEQDLSYAHLPPETKAALEKIRRQVLGHSR